MKMLLNAVLVMCLMAIRMPAAAAADWGRSEARISQAGADGDTAWSAEAPAVAYNSIVREYLVVWHGAGGQAGLAPGEYEIWGQRINALTGMPIGDDFRISSMGTDGDAEADAMYPAVAYNSQRNEWLVVWQGDNIGGGQANDETEIFGQRLNAQGEEIGADDFRISDMGPDGQSNFDAERASAAYNSVADEYLVVWQGDDNSGKLVNNELEIFGQRLNGTAGDPLGDNDFRISSTAVDGNVDYDALMPDAVYNIKNNEYFVVWEADTNSTGLIDGEFEIYGRRVTAAGATAGAPVRISAMGPDGSADYDANHAAAAYNGTNNEYLVVWEGDHSVPGLNEREIFGRRLNAANIAALSPSFRISQMGVDGQTAAAASSPDAAYTADGNQYLVVWHADDGAGALINNENEIYGQFLAGPNSAAIGGVVRWSEMGKDGSTLYQGLAPAAVFGAGQQQVVIAWSGSDDAAGLAPGENEIYAYIAADSDSDGIPDVDDPDDDNDGLPDSQEASIRTSKSDRDSDDDGVEDGQEVLDGSNPRDRGSVLAALATTLCSEWNGFLGGMWNILEHVNMSSADFTVQSTLFDIGGSAQGSQTFRLPAGRQLDLLVHDLTGWTLNSYGKVCSTIVGAGPGALDGRMVYYKQDPAPAAADVSFQFAFAMPFLNGLRGMQWVPFNTFQPSLDPADGPDLVANWIQVTNLEVTTETGVLTFFAQDGSLLGVQSVELSGGARRDYSGHQFGNNVVGVAQWTPARSSAAFQLRNVRYLYDNPAGSDSFASAFQLEGMVGSGERLAAPLDASIGSAILELANTLSAPITVQVELYESAGTLVQTQTHQLAPHASVHIITDAVLNGRKGLAVVQGSQEASVAAVVMQYARTPSAGIRYLYGIAARQPLGSALRSSYNTYLSQGCRLLLGNSDAVQAAASVSMMRFDGTQALAGSSIPVPANGMVDFDLCANDRADVYGVVTVQPDKPSAITANIVRVGPADSYRFPTPVRQ